MCKVQCAHRGLYIGFLHHVFLFNHYFLSVYNVEALAGALHAASAEVVDGLLLSGLVADGVDACGHSEHGRKLLSPPPVVLLSTGR